MSEPVQIPIPRITTVHCQMIRACSATKTADPRLLNLFDELKRREPHVARLENGSDESYAILFGGDSPRGKHLHIDVGRRGYFDEPPEVTDDVTRLERLAGEFAGQTFQVRATGRYVVELAEIPSKSFVKVAMLSPITDKEFQIDQTGASFSFRGSPLRHIYWFTTEGAMRVEIVGEMTAEMDESFMHRVQRLVDTAFERLVLSVDTGATNGGSSASAQT